MTILRAFVATLFAILVATTALAMTQQYPMQAVLLVCIVALAAFHVVERARP